MDSLLSNSSEKEELTQEIMKADNYVPSTEKMKKRKYYIGSDEVITAKLSVLLDKYSISNRDVIRIISATTEALDHDPPM